MGKKIQGFIKRNWVYILIILLILVGERFIGTAQVSGISMQPTCYEDDLLLVRRTDRVKIGNIVAIWSTDLNEFLCKRVIGLGSNNDHIKIQDGVLYRNNKIISEPYIKDQDWHSVSDIDITLSGDEVFVMGDNRNHSTDSRELGVFHKSEIYGVSIMNLTNTLGIRKKTVGWLFIILWLYLIISCIISHILKKYKDTKAVSDSLDINKEVDNDFPKPQTNKDKGE